VKTILILTVGLTDVQLVQQGKKCEFEKTQVGALHDRLREHPGSWKLVDSPSKRGDVVKELAEGSPWEICTPKFDAVLTYFGNTLPNSLLLLETTRNIPSDPRFAGGVLQKRAKDKGIEVVQCLPFLGPTDRDLEDRDCPLDAIIRREVVRRVEGAVRDTVKEATRIVVATTGGMPEIKVLVKELTRLHAPVGVEPDEIEVDDGARNSGQPDKAVSRKRVDPIEPVRLRKQVLALIEKGNLIGAWGAVQHLDAKAHPWTLVVQWLYSFASSLPLPEGCDLEVLSHQRMAVRAALRVELALRAHDIPRAVHGTVAFFEAAFWDWLRQRDLASEDGVTGGDQISGFTFNAPLEGEKKTRFKHRNRINDFAGGVQAWLPKLDKDALGKYWTATESIRELRHDVAHNEPTTTLMNDACTRMQDAKLWSRSATFLSQPLVQDVLKELGEAQPEKICANLLSEVRGRLLLL
jgi:hypothetical protein